MGETNQKIAAVAVVGGTHGNELTGIYLLKHWQKNALVTQYPRFQIELLQANPAAALAGKRYLESDLNRCFKLADLNDPDKNNQEQKLAKQINQMLGPKGDARVDFIIDLHTSTANMQTNLVLIKTDAFHLALAAYLKKMIPNAIVTSESQLMSDHHFLSSIADKGLLIEVGPIAQGCLDGKAFNQTEAALKHSLDFVDAYNAGELPALGETLEIMSYFDKLYFPTDDQGDICATVHPDLIGKDFAKLTHNTPLFRKFDGEVIDYHGADTHAAFINEAAYYDQQIAMCLCNPKTFSLKTAEPID